jgi:broad specificity phosphatase PhoE
MSRLFLVRHSLPDVARAVEPSQWGLGDEGRRRARLLAARLPSIGALFSSEERRALETAAIVGAALNLVPVVRSGLHEHERSSAGWLEDGDFRSAIDDFFRTPGDLVFGSESADEAYHRINRALSALMAARQDDVAVVGHGTVIALYAGRATGVNPYELWSRLGMPSVVALSWPGLRLIEIIDVVK